MKVPFLAGGCAASALTLYRSLSYRLPALLLVLAAVLFLASCESTDKENAYRCPRPGLLPQADRLPVFAEGAAPVAENIAVRAEIPGYSAGCTPVPRQGVMRVALTLSFSAERLPPAGDMKALTVPYFVAILDPAGEIVRRDRHRLRLVFGEQSGKLVRRNAPAVATLALADAEHVVDVAAADPMMAGDYRVVFGFELTPEQLSANTEFDPRQKED